MADQPVEIAHPPQALLRVLNHALRTPLGPALKDFMAVSFTGRKTGRHFSVPVSAHHVDGQLYVILNAGWKYNFRDNTIPSVAEFTAAANRLDLAAIRLTPAN